MLSLSMLHQCFQWMLTSRGKRIFIPIKVFCCSTQILQVTLLHIHYYILFSVSWSQLLAIWIELNPSSSLTVGISCGNRVSLVCPSFSELNQASSMKSFCAQWVHSGRGWRNWNRPRTMDWSTTDSSFCSRTVVAIWGEGLLDKVCILQPDTFFF